MKTRDKYGPGSSGRSADLRKKMWGGLE